MGKLNSPERPNSLEKLAQIAQQGTEVTPVQINSAYKKAKVEIKKRYKKMKANPEVVADYNDRLAALKNKMLEDVSKPQGMYEKARAAIVGGTMTVLGTAESIFGDEHESFSTYRKYVLSKTDPDGDEPIAEDYPGWGADNKINDTRSLLSGYLLGLQVNDPQVATKAMERTHEIYENSAGFFGDKVLTTEHLMNDLGMEAYVKEVAEFGLAKEPTGLLAGYLKFADSLEPGQRKTYREYFFKKLGDLSKAKKLDYKAKKDEPEIMKDYSKGEFQLAILDNEIKPPRQFFETTADGKDVREKKISNTVDKVAAVAVATSINPGAGLMTAYNAVFGDDPEEQTKKEARSDKKKNDSPDTQNNPVV